MCSLSGLTACATLPPGDFYCSTIVQPIEKIAQTCVDFLLEKDRSNLPALICLPVTYAAGGTTREPAEEG